MDGVIEELREKKLSSVGIKETAVHSGILVILNGSQSQPRFFPSCLRGRCASLHGSVFVGLVVLFSFPFSVFCSCFPCLGERRVVREDTDEREGMCH